MQTGAALEAMKISKDIAVAVLEAAAEPGAAQPRVGGLLRQCSVCRESAEA